MLPTTTTTDSFADRRVRALRAAVRGGNPLFRPQLPAVLVENSEQCATDKEGRRVLPDGSQWVVSGREGRRRGGTQGVEGLRCGCWIVGTVGHASRRIFSSVAT